MIKQIECVGSSGYGGHIYFVTFTDGSGGCFTHSHRPEPGTLVEITYHKDRSSDDRLCYCGCGYWINGSL